MDTEGVQQAIVESIEQIVDSKLSSQSTTTSIIGVIMEEPKGFDVVVKINNEEHDATLPEHLHTWVQKDDVVILNDLYGDGRLLMVSGKTGSIQKSPSLVFYDKDQDRNISGRDGIFDEQGEKLNVTATVGMDKE